MAAYYKLYGLLFVFMNCFKPSLARSKIKFVEEPKADKSCYEPNENGILTTTVSMQDLPPSLPYPRYMIAWSSNPNEDGTTWFIYDDTFKTFGLQDPSRWETKVHYNVNFIKYKLEVKDMTFEDETAGLYAFVIDGETGLIVAKSSAKARFNVDHDCSIPTNDIPLTKEADPDSSASLTHTSSSSPSPSSEEGYLSQKSYMEEIISWFTVSENADSWTSICTCK